MFVKKILLLGSGELGKEFVISAKRYGQFVIAVDSYKNAPAMQVADEYEIINMLDADALKTIVEKHKPDIIIPEIEAIRTEVLYDFEKDGIQVTPSAKAVNYTMNRKAIRNLASEKLGILTAKFEYASSLVQLKDAVNRIGIPCVVKPLMSSSGKGQSYIKSEKDIEKAWNIASTKGRGDLTEIIVEEFVNFEFEITLLTVTQKSGITLFCPPIGHRQDRGDYQESWQPQKMNPELLIKAQNMAKLITNELTGAGIWGVEFFIGENDVYFSELSPRPHDTGMVTLAGTQNFNEFELHLRAVLGLQIPEVKLKRAGASAVILANNESENFDYDGVEKASSVSNSDFRIFGKPFTREYRRMGVAYSYGKKTENTDILREKAMKVAGYISIINKN